MKQWAWSVNERASEMNSCIRVKSENSLKASCPLVHIKTACMLTICILRWFRNYSVWVSSPEYIGCNFWSLSLVLKMFTRIIRWSNLDDYLFSAAALGNGKLCRRSTLWSADVSDDADVVMLLIINLMETIFTFSLQCT